MMRAMNPKEIAKAAVNRTDTTFEIKAKLIKDHIEKFYHHISTDFLNRLILYILV